MKCDGENDVGGGVSDLTPEVATMSGLALEAAEAAARGTEA